MLGMQTITSNIQCLITVMTGWLQRIRHAPRPRYSLPLALLMSILQNAPVADTRQQITIEARIAPKMTQEIAGSGAVDQHGQKHLLHRICPPFHTGQLSASSMDAATPTQASSPPEIQQESSQAARRHCGDRHAYLLKTPVQGNTSEMVLQLTWVSI